MTDIMEFIKNRNYEGLLLKLAVRKYNFFILCVEKKEELKKQIITLFKERIKKDIKLKVEEGLSNNIKQFKIVFDLRNLDLKDVDNLIDFCKQVIRLNGVFALEVLFSYNVDKRSNNYLILFKKSDYSLEEIQKIFTLIKGDSSIIHKEIVNGNPFIIINSKHKWK